MNYRERFENYANRRYGDTKGNEHTVTAWKGFKNTVYNFSDTRRIRGKYAITIRPNLNFSPWVSCYIDYHISLILLFTRSPI